MFSPFRKRCLAFTLAIPALVHAQLATGPVADANTTAPAAAAISSPTQGKIGFVDIELVIEQSTAIRMAMDSLDQVMAEKARTIDSKEREFRRNRFEMDRQERILSGEERERKRLELVKMQEEIEKLKFEFDSELRVRERQIEPVLEHIMRIVADVADEQGFDIVLRGEVIIYGRSTADLTPAIIEKLDSNVAEVIKLFKDAQIENGLPDPIASPDESVPAKTPLPQPIEEAPTPAPEPILPLVPQ